MSYLLHLLLLHPFLCPLILLLSESMQTAGFPPWLETGCGARPVLFHQLFTAQKKKKKKQPKSQRVCVAHKSAGGGLHMCNCDMKRETARACVKAGIPRGVAWRAKCEPSKLLRPRKLTTGRVGLSNCCFSCCVTAKKNSSAPPRPSAQMCERVFGTQ